MAKDRIKGAVTGTVLGTLLGVAPASLAQAQSIATGENTEPVVAVPSGFAISLDGMRTHGSAQIEDRARKADLALAAADIQMRFDGLDLDPRLTLHVMGDAKSYGPGDTLRVKSVLNYAAFVARGELRLVDLDALGGPKTVLIQAITPGGAAQMTLPDEGRFALTHRVYDAKGRFDETRSVLLESLDPSAEATEHEAGLDTTARLRIPLRGGAVTISGRGLPPRVKIRALDTPVIADAQGNFVIQRILPPGRHAAQVVVTGAGTPLNVTRWIEIPEAEWFGVGSADLTIGQRDGDLSGSESYTRGRIAGFIDAKRADGTRITASIDTGEEELGDLFRRFDERDPRNTLLRVDPDDLYPTYGDDSTLEERAPTQGKLFLRVEKAGNFAQWGDVTADVSGGHYLRNERKLYGAAAGYFSAEQTSKGAPKVQITGYAAQPDQLAQRDVFQATGGSVYFLRRQDIAIGTESLSVQLRDRTTGRVLDTIRLTAGKDYDINYIQGVVTLAAPLSGAFASRGIVQTAPSGDVDVSLVAQYEFTPGISLDDFAYGTRAMVWATDALRLGYTGMLEQTDLGEQRMASVDLRYEFGETSFASLDYAVTDGPGIGASLSSDSGLVFDTSAGATGSGSALRAEISLTFEELDLSQEGAFSAYYETREEGFSSLDYRVTSATGDETLWGFSWDMALTDQLRVSALYDDYSAQIGTYERTGEIDLRYAQSDAVEYAFGVESIDKNRTTERGQRLDAAARVRYRWAENREIYAFAQGTLSRDGLPQNDRFGLGGVYKFDGGLKLSGEVSSGSGGAGGRILGEFDRGTGRTGYFGYELTPGRDFAGVDLTGTDAGRYILGGSVQVSETTSYFGENTYDLYGQHRALTSAYGVTFQRPNGLSYTGAIEAGQVRDDVNGDFDRRALSLGVRLEETDLTAAARLEYRTDEGDLNGGSRDARTLLVSGHFAQKLDDARRVTAAFEASNTQGDGLVPGGDLVDITVGYALRPVTHDRLNVLVRYRYLYDTYGQRIDGSDVLGPVQRSHVVSVDGIYEVNAKWEIGGKLGARLGQSAAASDQPWAENNAWLGVVNARYHMDHAWDALIELRQLTSGSGEAQETGVLGAIYRKMGKHVKAGVGMNWGSFSDDLTDLTYDDHGAFINVVASF
ncbi:MAG: hypothetical protein AAGD04_07705 [Pseudomonadota bacterium]